MNQQERYRSDHDAYVHATAETTYKPRRVAMLLALPVSTTLIVSLTWATWGARYGVLALLGMVWYASLQLMLLLFRELGARHRQADMVAQREARDQVLMRLMHAVRQSEEN